MEKIIITYDNETFVESIKNQVLQIGGTIEEVIELANIIVAMVPESKTEFIKQLPGVTFVGKDEPMVELGSSYSWHIDFMKILEFHRANNKGDGIKVAIIDTGVDYNHPSLRNNYKGGYNVITGSNNAMDYSGHGTSVAGVIAADGSELDIIGIAPKAQIYGVCVWSKRDGFTSSKTVKGIQWAIENNMDIINLSLGAKSWTSVYYNNILKKAKDKGIVVVAAAGSQNEKGVKAPACCNDSIAVASIRSEIYNFEPYNSNYGPEVDISAPGSAIKTTKLSGGSRYFYGTSAAAPIISGIMALLKKKYPMKSVDELATVMYDLCKDIGSPGKDIYTGYGVPILSVQQETTFPVTMTSVPLNASITVD